MDFDQFILEFQPKSREIQWKNNETNEKLKEKKIKRICSADRIRIIIHLGSFNYNKKTLHDFTRWQVDCCIRGMLTVFWLVLFIY